MNQGVQRISYLDSMRGVAAFSVLIYHFMFSLDNFNYWQGKTVQHWLSCVFNGSDAVSFFFVLSGLVLSYRYFNPPQESVQIHYKKFIVQRLFRIFPAYIVMLIGSFLYAHREELSLAFIYEAVFLHDYQFVQEIILFRNYASLYTPGWTLSVELVMSFLVPVLVIIIYKAPRTFAYLIPISILLSAFISAFIFHFMLGVWLGKNYKRIQEYPFNQSSWYRFRYLIYILVLAFLSIRHIDRVYPLENIYYYLNHYLGLDFFHVTGLASFLILCKAINDSAWQRILNFSLFRFLGTISYSIYLTHWFVIFYLYVPQPKDIAGLLGLSDHIYQAGFIFCVGITLVLSIVFYYTIEQPFNRIGKSIARRLNEQAESIT